MNKYQKAYNDIVDNGVTTEYFNEQADKPHKHNTIFIINELVDKAIPVKPNCHGLHFTCGCCGSKNISRQKFDEYKIILFKYCSNCGHKIDWSE